MGYDPLDTLTPVVCGGDEGCTHMGQEHFKLIYSDREDVWKDHRNGSGYYVANWNQNLVKNGEDRYRIWQCEEGHVWIEKFDDIEDLSTPAMMKLADSNGEILQNALTVAAGNSHLLVLTQDGQVYAAGSNTFGELGQNTTTKRIGAVKVLGYKGRDYLDHVADVTAGENFSVALMENGTVYTWGANNRGQLGNELVNTGENKADRNYSATPVQVNSGEYGLDGSAQFRTLAGVTQISAGGSHVVVVAQENRWDKAEKKYVREAAVFAWGDNSVGQLGRTAASTPFSIAPLKIEGLTGVTAMSAGGQHTLVRVTEEVLVDQMGEIDNPAYDKDLSGEQRDGDGNLIPEKIQGVVGQTKEAQERIIAFGVADEKVLSEGVQTGALVRVPAGEWPSKDGLLHDVSILSAGGAFSVVMMDNGRVMTWGDNNHGQLGVGATNEANAGFDQGWKHPYFAGEHQAAMVELSFKDGVILSGGDSSFTELVIGWSENQNEVVTINTNSAVNHSFQGFNLLTDGMEKTTMDLETAYPGFSFHSADESVVVVEQRDGKWVLRNAGTTYSDFQKMGSTSVAALDKDGNMITVFRVRVRGSYEENGTTKYRVATPMILGVTNGSTAGTVALRANGDVYIWGSFTTKDPTGTATRTVSYSTPRQMTVSNIVQIAAGKEHMVALDKDGNVYTWGSR